MLNFATFDFEAVWWIALPSCKIFSCLANNRRVELASWVDGRTPAGKWCAMQNTSMLHPPRYSFPPSAFRALTKQSIREKISKIISFSNFVRFVLWIIKLNERNDSGKHAKSSLGSRKNLHPLQYSFLTSVKQLEQRFRKSLASLVSTSLDHDSSEHCNNRRKDFENH